MGPHFFLGPPVRRVLADDARYAARFANVAQGDATTGTNLLDAQLTIEPR